MAGTGSISLAAPPRRIVIYKQVSQFSRFANLVSASFFASLLCVINVWLLIWRCTGGAAARPHFAMALSIVRPARETDWNARDANLELFSARRPTRCELFVFYQIIRTQQLADRSVVGEKFSAQPRRIFLTFSCWLACKADDWFSWGIPLAPIRVFQPPL